MVSPAASTQPPSSIQEFNVSQARDNLQKIINKPLENVTDSKVQAAAAQLPKITDYQSLKDASGMLKSNRQVNKASFQEFDSSKNAIIAEVQRIVDEAHAAIESNMDRVHSDPNQKNLQEYAESIEKIKKAFADFIPGSKKDQSSQNNISKEYTDGLNKFSKSIGDAVAKDALVSQRRDELTNLNNKLKPIDEKIKKLDAAIEAAKSCDTHNPDAENKKTILVLEKAQIKRIIDAETNLVSSIEKNAEKNPKILSKQIGQSINNVVSKINQTNELCLFALENLQSNLVTIIKFADKSKAVLAKEVSKAEKNSKTESSAAPVPAVPVPAASKKAAAH